MESNNNSDQFEHFLREKADEFRMYPSRRVWYSIYNNMHPGSRLPSISMCIILLSSLLLTGYLNTSSVSSSRLSSRENQITPYTTAAASKAVSNVQTIAFIEEQQALASTTSRQNLNNAASPINSHNAQVAGEQSGNAKEALSTGNLSKKRDVLLATARRNASVSIQSGTTDATAEASAPISEAGNSKANIDAVSVITDQPSSLSAENATASLSPSNIEEQAVHGNPVTEAQSGAADIATTEKKSIASNRQLSESEKEWIDHYALYNRPAPKKWKGRTSLQAYFTPAVVYRTLRYNVADKPRVGPNAIVNGDVNDFLDNKPSFGLETGVALVYKAARNLKLKAGMQLNYTRYNAHAYQNFHPVATSLTMNDGFPYEVFATSPYTNSYGITPVKLHNETVQFSVPLGADLKLAAIDNIEWYAGATIQPTVLLYANSYVISTDRRSYVNDPGLLNRFNLNAGFETYLTFKTNGYTWQAGPQFRTQLFSTNTKRYSVEERLMGYGFKIGVSKKL